MKPEILNQYNTVYSDPPERIREAARALCILDRKILLTYEENTGVYMSPGGGLESGETLEECCIRELKEEAGVEVKPVKQYITINEYSFETLYVSNYFICEIIGEAEQRLTEIEVEHGVMPKWLELEQAMEIFSTYPEKQPDVRSLYLREYTVIGKYIKHIKSEQTAK